MSYQKRTRAEINTEKRDLSDQIKARVDRLAQITDEMVAGQYIALWRGDSEKIMQRFESIRKAASTIIKEVENHVSHHPETGLEAEDEEAPLESMPRVRTAVLA